MSDYPEPTWFNGDDDREFGDPDDDREPPDPDGEDFRGDEAAAYERDQQADIQTDLK